MDAYGSPDRDRTCCLLGRSQVLYPDELRSHTTNSRLAWTGSNRSTSPMSRGRSSAELQARGCRPRIRTRTIRVNNSTRYRLALRGSGGEKGIRTPTPTHVRRPTWVATRPRHQLGYLFEEEGERVERSCRLVAGFRFRDGGPCQWAIPPYVCCAGWSRRDRTADFLDVGEALCRLSYGPMTAARVMPCRGGGARSTTRPSEPGDRRETDGTRGRTRTSDEPGVGSRRSAAELRACGRRDWDRTDALLCLRQALYAF